MQKAYDHNASEDNIYAQWETSGAMRADNTSDKDPFTIVLPPPNVTGQLHLGHAAMLAIEDILIRYKSMTGKESLWVPGTDHAAIATNTMVMKHLGLQSFKDMPREDFLRECRKFAAEKHDRIVGQSKKMGTWLDWSREAYTFDEARNHAVTKIFKMLYEDGLIERGYRMINWSVGAQSVLADDELEWEDRGEPFYYIRCGEFIIGTVRSETKNANSPVIVHPEGEYARTKFIPTEGEPETMIFAKVLFDDKERLVKMFNLLEGEFELTEVVKGKDLAGQEFEYDTYAGKRKFYVLADEVIDMEKGTGAMTISVNHATDDYELAQKHNLKDYYIEKLDFEGNMTAVAGPCKGMPVAQARKESGKIMKEMGLLVGQDNNYTHRVPLCYRSGCVVEPMISPQWFIMVEKEFTDRFSGETTTLKKQMQEAVRGGHVKIIPERFEKIYFHWIDNLRDWCISRQIWWGHRIPVWYDDQDQIHLPKEQKITFIRHGETDSNKAGCYNNYEESLNENGRKQIQDAAPNLNRGNITKIISSSLPRAKESTAIIAEELGITDIEYWEEIIEAKAGPLAGKPNIKDENDRIQNVIDLVCTEKGGETEAELFTRAQIFWDKIKEVQTEGEILVVGHGAMTSALFAYKKGVQPGQLRTFRNKSWQRLGNGDTIKTTVYQAPEGQNLHQDEDTLDTWFSSALWPFSTLGWPDDNPDFDKFYPNDVLETGWDILFFWVARMIMFGRYATGKYPFHTVYLHGLVCDEHGKKMSKSKGNGIDPLEVIEEVGADAVRLSLVIGTSPGNPIPLGKNKIKGYRNFVNKLWNAGRFIQMQLENASEASGEKSLADKWILSRLSHVASEVAENLEKYEISSAGDAIYHFVWDEFCDWYIEASKVELNPETLKYVYGEILKLTHPLCPFVTETIWQELFESEGSIMDHKYPAPQFHDEEAEKTFTTVQNLVTEIRRIRAEKKLNPKEKISAKIRSNDSQIATTPELLKVLGNLSEVEIGPGITKPEKAATSVIDGHDLYVEIPFDEGAEKARLEKEVEQLQKKITGLEGRLSNPSYTEKAPAHLVQQTRDELTQAKEDLEKMETELKNL